MIKFHIDENQGTYIGIDEYRRNVKLFSSTNSIIKTKDFALGMTVIEPGQKHEEHSHDGNEEVMIIYEGEGIASINGENNIVKKGDIINVEKNEAHGFTNTGKTDFKILWIYYPQGAAEEKFLIR